MTESLVGKQEHGLDDERPRNATRWRIPGKLVRIGALEALQTETLEPDLGPFGLLVPIEAKQLERQPHVIHRTAPRQQAILLEHGREHAAEMIEIVVRCAAADGDAALRRAVEADDQVEDGRLAAPGLAYDRHHLAAADAEVEPLDRHHLVAGSGLLKQFAQPLTSMSAASVLMPPSQHTPRPVENGLGEKQYDDQNERQANTSATENSPAL